MTEHPADYPWSSYRDNALGQENKLITPHDEYLQLGANVSVSERQNAYRDLFNHHITQLTLEDIRQATNKAWILGSQHFKDQIEQQLNRRINPLPKGGDRKSAAYRERMKLNNDR